jgi:hypothetical protein
MSWPNPAVLFKGEVLVLEISGPGVEKQRIPTPWLKHEAS